MANGSPHYPLDEVKKLVAAGNFMVQKGRALNLLVPPLTYAEALGFIAAAIQMLSIDNFHRSVQLTYDLADEYGLNINGTGWYIKICIDRFRCAWRLRSARPCRLFLAPGPFFRLAHRKAFANDVAGKALRVRRRRDGPCVAHADIALQ